MRGLSLGAVAGVVTAAVLLVAGDALAQPGGGGGRGGGMGGGMGGFMGGREPFEPPVNSADLEKYAAILNLTPEQKEAARALLDAAMAEFQPAAKAARDKVEELRAEFRETRDPSVWQGMGEIMREYRTARNSVERTFMSDIQVLLSDEQAARWPTVERTHRRDRTIGRGLMSGERVDLIAIVDGMGLSEGEKSALAPVLDQYAADLDRELIKRNEVYDEGEQRGMEIWQDPEAREAMFNKGREASKRVRDVNERYARQLEGLLPDGKRAAFVERVKRESFPTVYRETYAHRVLAAAEKFTDLDDAQRASLAALRESFARDLAASNAKMEAAIREREDTADVGQMFFQRGGGPMQELRESRRSLERSTVQRVRDLLSEDQRARLPERGDDEEGWRGPDGQGRRAGRGDAADRDDQRPRRRRGRDDREPAPAPPPPENPR